MSSLLTKRILKEDIVVLKYRIERDRLWLEVAFFIRQSDPDYVADLGRYPSRRLFVV